MQHGTMRRLTIPGIGFFLSPNHLMKTQPGRVFSSSEHFPFLKTLEQEWTVIRDELLALEETDYQVWPERNLYDREAGWKAFGLRLFGLRQHENCARCPRTTALVEAIPGMTSAGFSRLTPGTAIKPHRGLDLGAYRCHLGLVIPEDCALRVAGETYLWKPGECVVFDDTCMHEVWNRGSSDRIVMILDFHKDPARPHLLGSFLGFLIRTKYRLNAVISRFRKARP